MIPLYSRRSCILDKFGSSIFIVIVTLVLLAPFPIQAEDSDAGSMPATGHKMGMKMKDGMKMGGGGMSDHKHGRPNFKPITPEVKKHIAEMYTKMGKCVETEMSVEDCQKKVMNDCPVVAELGYCPLMDGIAPMNEATTMN